ncbi:MAG TPA: HAMP domain-containing sensor histidine kinase [Pseudolysinimonas sp.]|nr:HAMP domain-containing sensor histidine kinase [Pseudolysinimonas sp.]
MPSVIRPASWSLQRRLVVGILVLLAVVSVIVGGASALVLRQNLMTRLDGQVVQSLDSALGNAGPRGGPPAEGNGPRRIGGLVLYSLRGVTVAAVIAEDGTAGALTAAQRNQLLGLTGDRRHPQTVDLGTTLGAYRVASGTLDDGTTVIVGQSLAEVNSTTNSLLLIFGLITLLALLVAAAAGTAVVRVALRPLGRVAATATRVSELELAKGEVSLADRVPDADTDIRTEVGQVGAALNRLLGHVEGALVARQASEDKVRQFVADASHELRTPLASIRGYSELTRRGGHELPDDVVRSLARIESESIRMTSLVEDLLLLARLDAGRELVLGEVDLVPLVVDAVSDAHAAAPDHDWQLRTPDSGVIVTGDGGRLQQVVANLLANARAHTPPGTHVVTTLSVDGDDALLCVQDDGPGISSGLLPVLFERFARGDGSRSRATGSTGLGLAIVSAVVDAHGGGVSVESAPGDTRFVVRIPLRLPSLAPNG